MHGVNLGSFMQKTVAARFFTTVIKQKKKSGLNRGLVSLPHIP